MPIGWRLSAPKNNLVIVRGFYVGVEKIHVDFSLFFSMGFPRSLHFKHALEGRLVIVLFKSSIQTVRRPYGAPGGGRSLRGAQLPLRYANEGPLLMLGRL